MHNFSLDFLKVEDFVDRSNINKQLGNCSRFAKELTNENVHWFYPGQLSEPELKNIDKLVQKVKEQSEILIVLGIGGSYLGTKAAIEFINGSFYNELAVSNGKMPVYFLGNNLSAEYILKLMDMIGDRAVSVNVVSKSGNTLETLLVFNLLINILKKRYGSGIKDKVYVTTERKNSYLLKLAIEEKYNIIYFPENVVGRFSALTISTLFPLAASGIDIRKVLYGAELAFNDCRKKTEKNDCFKYAAYRNELLKLGKLLEVMVFYEPSLLAFGEWWKQLFAESEGKDKKGIYPTTANFTTDLHSLGQYLQDGQRIIFETVLNFLITEEDIKIDNYLKNKTIDSINKVQKIAYESTLKAHYAGGVPEIVFNIPKKDEIYLGYMFYFFKMSCYLSARLLNVNPFVQEGVEIYKKNMLGSLDI